MDLIVAGGSDAAAIAAMKATASIPIVFVAVSDPVGLGLVKSLARPGGGGGKLTGLASFAEAITGKQLELLREALPHASRIAALNTPGDPINPSQLAGMRVASTAMKMQVSLHDVVSEGHLDTVFGAITQDRPDALQVFTTAATWFHQRRIIEFAATQRLPAVYANTAFVESGGLMAYSFSFSDLYRRTVGYVDKILKGASPSASPVEQPTKLDLVINRKTARALHVTFPQSLLSRADRVIE